MGTGWAVGSAVTLAMAVTAIAITGRPFAGEAWYLLVGVVPLVCVWAYAISMGAHGSRTALAALGVNVACVGIAAPLLVWRYEAASGFRAGPLLAVVTALVAALSLWAIVGETRHRGGSVRFSTLVGLALPLVATALAIYATRVLNAMS